MCFTANLCNGLLLKIIGQFVQKCTLGLVPDLRDKPSRTEIRQSKVKKTLILSTCHICSVTFIAKRYNMV